jgi:hypothetical protein
MRESKLPDSMPKLNFGRLSPTDFEEFTFHLLSRLGFTNLNWRKGTAHDTSPSDSGRDIVCQQIREDVDRTKHVETWFVDCKHYSKGVPPGELQNLLAWAEAERPNTVLIVASGFLSNPAKNYLEAYERNRRPPFRIKCWERPQLEQLVANKRSLVLEYGLSPLTTRPATTILKAEQEFCDVIWYDRKLVLQQKLKAGTERIDPEIKKGMHSAMRRMEARYGKKKLRNYYKDDFGWGMLSGKLSALRWVLGDEWDMLDT